MSISILGRGRGRAIPDRALSGRWLGAPGTTVTTAPRVRAQWHGQAFDPVPPGLRRGAGERRRELRQRSSAPPLAQGATGGDPRLPAASAKEPRSAREPGRVEELARRAFREDDAARRAAFVEDVVGFGQSRRAQNARASAVDVRPGHHGALHAAGRQLAEHDRVDPTHPRAPSAGRTTSAQARGDHRVAGGDGARVESGSDTFRVGRSPSGATGSRSKPAACLGR